MIERLALVRQSSEERAAPGVADQRRLTLTWYLDPITGRPASRWVLKGPEVSPNRELAVAA
jgi:hypothetical protein